MHRPKIVVFAPGTHTDASSLQLNGYFSHFTKSDVIQIRPPRRTASKVNTIRSLMYHIRKGLFAKADAYVVVGAMVASTLPGQLIAALKNKPLIVEWDDMVVQDFSINKPKPYQLAYWEYRGVRKASGVMCVSKGLMQVAKSFGHTDEHIVWVPMGVDTTTFDPKNFDQQKERKKLHIPPDAKVMGYVGNIPALQEGTFVGAKLIEIFEEYRKLEPKAFLLFVGAGTGLSLLYAMIKERKLEACSLITGHRPQTESPNCIAAMDIGSDVLLEDWPARVNLRYRSSIKMKEYMSMGKPTLAHPVGENSTDLDQGALGILVDKDAKTTAREIHILLKDVRKLANIKEKARKKALEIYSFAILGPRFEDFILSQLPK